MQNKSWLITGASAGLGLLLTKTLLQRGDRVFATVRASGALAELQTQYPHALTVLYMEMTDADSISKAVDDAFSLAHIDIVVSNAGYGLFGIAESLTDEQITRQIQTNLLGSIILTRATLPYFRNQHGGRFIQISSEGGQVAYPNFSVYHASKWGIEGFIEAVAQEVEEFGIEFLLAEPGPTGTNFVNGMDVSPLPEAYLSTRAAQFHRAVLSGEFEVKGDAQNTVNTLLSTAESEKMPRRLALGSIAYDNIKAALSLRLRELESQKDLAFSADKSE